MTLEEFQENVTPLIQEIKKLLRTKYFKTKGYYSIELLTKDEYFKSEIEDLKKRGYEILANEEYVQEDWDKMGLKNDTPPKELTDRYQEIISKLSPLYFNLKYASTEKPKTNKHIVRAAISDEVYLREIKEGEYSFKELENVTNSLGIKIPQRLLKLKAKAERYDNYDHSMKIMMIKRNQKFIDDIRISLEPYKEDLKNKQRDKILKFHKEFEESGFTSVGKYVENKTDDRNEKAYISSFFYSYYDRFGKKISNYNEKLEQDCEDFAESYVRTFIERIEEKLALVNDKYGAPEIDFHRIKFSYGNLEADFTLTYLDGMKLIGDTQVIVAGGWNIQSSHTRYLFHFYNKGKRVSLKQIDEL